MTRRDFAPLGARSGNMELVEIALAGVRATMGIDAKPDVSFVKRWERGIPSYTVGHPGRVSTIFRHLRAHPGLYLNSNAYQGISLNDCVANARRCAEAVLAD